jgi:hypothetical protein
LDLERIVGELEEERERLNRAIAALRAESPSTITRHNGRSGGKRQGRGLTPEGRKRLSDAMKRRWAERRRKAKS